MTTIDIDLSAPVVSRHRILVRAPLDLVWEVHTAIADWPTWQPDVDSAQPHGPLAPGASFRWQTHGLDITSHVHDVEPRRRIAWGGPASGIDGIHVWTFTEHDLGVLVDCDESWSGEGVLGAVEEMQTALDGSLTTWLESLKAECESRAA